MKLGIFGGSFNPVHRGHVEIVQLVLFKKRVDRVIIVPAYKNPLKQNLALLPEQLRCEMLKAVFDPLENVNISFHELREQKTSYSYPTVQSFKKQYPSAALYLMLGQDTFNQFHLWKNFEGILKLSNLLVYKRAQVPLLENPRISNEKVEWINGKISDVSSTLIRSSTYSITQELQWLHPNTARIWEAYRNRSNIGKNGNKKIIK